MMDGPPGSGKTTLAEGLVRTLGPRTFCFSEDALFEIDEFADVAVAFRTKAFPDTGMMLDAYRRFFDRIRNDTDTVVFDWSCTGMIEDLPCAQPDRMSLTTHRPEMRSDPEVLASHARAVAGLVERTVLFVPEVPIATAIGRAHAQRGERWFDGWPEVKASQGDGSFLDAAVSYWEAGAPRHKDCVRAHEAGGWDIVRLDANAMPSDVLEQALSALGPR
jgi:hypothetical protein